MGRTEIPLFPFWTNLICLPEGARGAGAAPAVLFAGEYNVHTREGRYFRTLLFEAGAKHHWLEVPHSCPPTQFCYPRLSVTNTPKQHLFVNRPFPFLHPENSHRGLSVPRTEQVRYLYLFRLGERHRVFSNRASNAHETGASLHLASSHPLPAKDPFFQGQDSSETPNFFLPCRLPTRPLQAIIHASSQLTNDLAEVPSTFDPRPPTLLDAPSPFLRIGRRCFPSLS